MMQAVVAVVFVARKSLTIGVCTETQLSERCISVDVPVLEGELKHEQVEICLVSVPHVGVVRQLDLIPVSKQRAFRSEREDAVDIDFTPVFVP